MTRLVSAAVALLLGLAPVAARADMFSSPAPGCPASGCTVTGAFNLAQPASIQFNGSRVWSGTQAAVGNAEISSFTNQSGATTAGGSVAFHYFGIASDTLQSTNPVGNVRSELTTGTGITGGRSSVWGSINIGGTPGTAGQYVAGTFAAVATAPANAGGNILYGTNPTAGLNAAATGAWSVIGEEIDVRAVTGSAPVSLTGLTIVTVGGHDVHGSANLDSAIAVGNQPSTSTGWDYILRIGGPGNPLPVVSTATLIATWSGISGLAAANGVDFSSMTFSGNSWNDGHVTISGAGVVKTAKLNLAGITTTCVAQPTGTVAVVASVFTLCP